ncbi:hemolysin D [Adhaeribacter aerolatus]|uniref:Hemolysin D n=1 Tax=Adhaeribacter aerolatus TaxID=670289 RepID=A0A512ATQ5_9BACT|nr:efflux RND transporter periplasmic adaptor subunit [Adhaeribacter aerolatus]GEO03101.1 hemolysin D [Adhaeribacter aerolatus]
MKIFKNISLLYALSAGALLGGCVAKGDVNEKQNAIPVVPVTRLVTHDTTLLNEYVAQIQAVRHIDVRARVNGFLDAILVDEGQTVKKGQPLFRLSSAEHRAELARTKANLKTAIAEAKAAELEVARVQLMVDKKVISKSELEVAQVKLSAANARIDEARSAQDNAQTKLSYTNIKAPFSGVIDRIPFKTGSLISEGTLLTTLSDLKDVYAYFNVSEKEYLNYLKSVQQGTNTRSSVVDLVLADGKKYPLKGKIETVESVFEANTGSIAFRAKFPNPHKLLKHNSTGTVHLASDVNDVVMVPQKATFEVQDQNFVYVVDKENKVKTRNFKPKTRFSHFYIVDSGLKPGDNIVYEGVQEIRDGEVIKPSFIPMDSILATNP